MSDPREPEADDRLLALIDGLEPGDPLADEIERLLDDAPLHVDEADVDGVTASLLDRLDPAPRRVGPPAWAWGLAAAAALALVAGLSWQAGHRAAEPGPAESVIAAPAHAPAVDLSPTEVLLGDGTIAETREDTVVLLDGVVSIDRSDPRQPGAHRVRLSALDLSIEPVGTDYSVGVTADLAAIWVREGRVRLQHAQEGHLGEVAAGGWALVIPDGPGLQLRRLPDGPFDAGALGLSEADARLLAKMRWLALPAATRAEILPADD